MRKVIEIIRKIISGLRHECWTYSEAIFYFIGRGARKLKIERIWKFCEVVHAKAFLKRWLKHYEKESYFDFGICKLPDISSRQDMLLTLMLVWDDVFKFPCCFNDNYDKNIVLYHDKYMEEGPYGYTDGVFDVTVKKGDVVIDAGAWIGDFSAYAVSKGATTYAFEPVKETFQLLCETKTLNNIGHGIIHPIQKGLGSRECEMDISISNTNNGSNSIYFLRGGASEKIAITTIDKFVEKNKLERIDFIKADIEGAEREMLRGATNVLKTFAPRLAICTYHLPDDPEVLENIIKEANPAYKVIHIRHKLFAAVV
jgi:FkbM family methyltransferase